MACSLAVWSGRPFKRERQFCSARFEISLHNLTSTTRQLLGDEDQLTKMTMMSLLIACGDYKVARLLLVCQPEIERHAEAEVECGAYVIELCNGRKASRNGTESSSSGTVLTILASARPNDNEQPSSAAATAAAPNLRSRCRVDDKLH